MNSTEDEILAGIPHVKCNRDDCLIGGKDWYEHNRTLDLVLTRLQDHGLTLKLDKCEFGKEEVEFYGVRFTAEGIKPSKEKVRALRECGEPNSKEGVRSFLQMVGYMSRFITNFAQIAAPLRQLTKSTSKFSWGPQEQATFESLKNSLSEQTTLAYFVPGRPIRIYVDAGKKTEKSSNVPGGLCAILCQQDDEGQWKMCHVANRALTDVETRYGQTELEAAAIKFACADALYEYLVGAPKFEIITDCKPLVHLFNNPTSRAPLRIERQILAIQGLDYVVKYQKGAENIADYGSRHLTKHHNDVFTVKSVNEMEEGLRTIVSEENEYLLKMAKDDSDYQFLKEVIQNNLWKRYGNDGRIARFLGVASDLSVVEGIVLYKDKVIPPLTCRRRLVQKAHKIGHSGEIRTLKLLQEKIWFPGIAKLCKEAVQNCQSCQFTHDRTHDEPLQSTPLPPGAWHTISVDFKGPLKDGTYALVGYDLYSRYPVVSFCRSTSFSCVKPILDSWFSTFGTVRELKSDRGPPFNGYKFSEYAREKGFVHKPVKPRHPRGNGEAEKFMQNLKKIERIARLEKKKYRTLIEGMLNAYRATPHPATGKSPYELMFGRKMRLGVLPEMSKAPEREYDPEVRKNDALYKLKSKRYHDKRRNVKKSRIAVGDRILMKNKRTDPLSPIPGRVIQIRGNAVTARFDDGKVLVRDKSHFKIVRETSQFEERERERVETRDNRDEAVDQLISPQSGRQPVYVTRRGREVYLPDRFQS